MVRWPGRVHIRRVSSIDWRRVLIYAHRWLGIAGSLVFLVWFVSGVVMMYERMPRLTAEERLARLPPVDWSSANVIPAVAAAALPERPDRFRAGMLLGRPVYRFLADGSWTTVFADDGQTLQRLSEAESLAIVRSWWPQHERTLHYAGYVTSPDQWLLDGGLPRFLPMHRIALGDSAGTFIYVSERTGEPVMKTTARGRTWGYLGAVLHWTYFTPVRKQQTLWRYSIVSAALIGCVMCLSGLVLGIWRFSLSARYRIKRLHSHSPYAGLMWWHHYAGLLFGLFSFTWALSGALSLTPWDWTPSTAPLPAQMAAVAGGPLRIETVSIDRLRQAWHEFAEYFEPKELDVAQFQGRPFALAYRPDRRSMGRAADPDVRAIHSAHLAIEHRLIWLDRHERGVFSRFDDEAVVTAAGTNMVDAAISDMQWLHMYDAYYYDRWATKPLPVLRVRYADPRQTWLYLDPQSGSIALRYERRSRANRWLYHGLHSFDFPSLYFRRPLWDVLLIVLSTGGIVLTVTTMWPAFRRLRRHVRRVIAA